MSLAYMVLGAADRCAGALGVLSRRLRAEDFIATAERRGGTSGTAMRDAGAALQVLLDACVNEAALGIVGRFALHWDTLRFLGNLLRLEQQEARVPAILAQPIERPVFITGLPRSGTTFLHRLMLEDPTSRAPLVWQTIHPYPPATGPDRRVAQVARQLRAFERLAPQFRGLHPLEANSPQECSEIAAHTFRSLRFDSTYRVPTYRHWLDAEGHLAGYRFHRRFLQHLQYQEPTRPTRWVLKCPDHLFALADLRTAYPDARMVFVHRDPVKVLLSVSKLTEVLRRPFSRQVDKQEIGPQESARWLAGTERMMRACTETSFAERICHVHYLDLVMHPLKTVARVYDHFGMSLDEGTAGRIARSVAEHPNGGYGRHAYRFEDHGLNEAAEREKFGGYMRAFSIEPEWRRARPASAPPRSRAA